VEGPSYSGDASGEMSQSLLSSPLTRKRYNEARTIQGRPWKIWQGLNTSLEELRHGIIWVVEIGGKF
jgi:hypothetical protein